MQDSDTPVPATDAETRRTRFALVRYFALTSLVCILLIAGGVGWIAQHFALRDLTHLAEDRNVALTKAFANALWPRYAAIVDTSRNASADEMRAIVSAQALDSAAINQMRDTAVIKIKIYNLAGVTVFSTDARQIGENKTDNPGFRAAAAGATTSDLTHRDRFDAFEGTLNDLDVLATYLPINDERGKPVAVFEIYSDVTDVVQLSKQTQLLLITSVVALFGLLYGLLYLLVARAQKIIDAQAETLRDYLYKIETANEELDRKVNERTASLSLANRSLQREIDDRRAAESELKLAWTVFENSIEGITITDADERILAVNRAFTEVTGYQEEEVLGRTPRLLSSGKQTPEFYRALWQSLAEHGLWQGEVINRRRNGETYPEWLSISAVRDSSGIVTNYVAVFSDITAIKESEAKLDRLAHHDPLTDLPNRVLFNSLVAHAITHAHHEQRRLAVLCLDLDHFKDINDTRGHAAGDGLLKQVVDRLQSRLPETVTLARLGGDEFTVLLDGNVDPGFVGQVAKKLVSAFQDPFTVGTEELYITTSVGIALYPDDGGDVATLVKHADTAVHQAKDSGRNTYHFYDPAMTADAVERLDTEFMLRKCVANGELRLHYQPQFDALSGRLVGAEALVRWQHPVLGLTPPAKFIHIAEETGHIVEIGAWVLRESCRQFAQWRSEGLAPEKIAVNVSARQLEHAEFVALVRDALAEFAIPPACLELELTESTIMSARNAFDLLDQLHALGVELAIDDFGTGYSSLSNLKRLPIGKLKIDRSFIVDIATDPQDIAIVRSVIAMARTMGLTTLAEGVEAQNQISFLQQEGCKDVQGFFVGHPLPPEAMATLLAERAAGPR